MSYRERVRIKRDCGDPVLRKARYWRNRSAAVAQLLSESRRSVYLGSKSPGEVLFDAHL